MATYIKGNITYTPVVEQINRKFATKSKKCSASKEVGPTETVPNSFMGGATRQSTRVGLGTVKKNYFFYRENASSRQIDEAQMERQVNFTAGNRWAVAAAKDLGAMTHNQLVWNYLRENAGKTMDGMSAQGYTLAGLLRAYAIKKFAGGGTPAENHKLPVPEGMPEP